MTAFRSVRFLLAVVLLASLPVAPAQATPWAAGTHKVALTIDERVAGTDRYETAVAVARKSYPSWSGVDHVVIASGENRSMSDPLTAASLCWAYDAPLLLVTRSGLPASVQGALEEMRSVADTVTVTVIGGPLAVPDQVVAEIGEIVGSENVERPWPTGDRYETAAGIAELTAQVASETERTIPARALIANGTDDAGFVDAAAASAVSAATGVPVLLVRRNQVPPVTRTALDAMEPGRVFAVGGSAVISDAVYADAEADARWAGENRYATAAAIATGARGQGWLTGSKVGIASALPDALTGATYVGRLGGPLLFVSPDSVKRATAGYLDRNREVVTAGILFGGTRVLPGALVRELSGAPTPPRILAPSSGDLVANKARVVATVGINTTAVDVYAGNTLVATRPVTSYSTVDFGAVRTPAQGVEFHVVARNPDGGAIHASRGGLRKLSYPAPNSIVVAKSEFRLYFVKDDVFVKSYPVAIGRSNAETPVGIWRIGSKYHTSASSVYGPRKMRMYRQRGSSFVYTAYNIHGTNQPSSIGTKASAGCIRLYNHDILDLFPRVPIGTIVQTRQ